MGFKFKFKMSFFGLSANYGNDESGSDIEEIDNDEEPSLRDVLRSVTSLSKSVRELKKQVHTAGTSSAVTTETGTSTSHGHGLSPGSCWADVPISRPTHYDSDEEDAGGGDAGDLVEVSEETSKILTASCTRSVPNEARKRARKRHPLPKVTATKTPRLDPYLKSEISAGARAADNELARTQTFVLDAIAPLTTVLEKGHSLSREQVREATLTAVDLLGNANTRISRLRREKVINDLNKSLTPLVKEDDQFREAPPNLFGPDFAKRSKEFMDQLQAMRPQKKPNKQPFFRKGPPSSRGGTRPTRGGYRGGKFPNYRSGGHNNPPREQKN